MTIVSDQKMCEAVRKFSVLHGKQYKYFKDKNKKRLTWEDVANEADLVNGN